MVIPPYCFMDARRIVRNVLREYSALFRMLEEYDRSVLVRPRDSSGVAADLE